MLCQLCYVNYVISNIFLRWFPESLHKLWPESDSQLANSFEFCATSWPDLKGISCDGFHVLKGNGSRFYLPFWKLVDSFQDPQWRTSGSVIMEKDRLAFPSAKLCRIAQGRLLWPDKYEMFRLSCISSLLWICLNLQIKSNRFDSNYHCSPVFLQPVQQSSHGRHPLEQSSQVLSRSFTSQLPTALRGSFVLCSRRCGELLRWCIGG